MAASFVTNYGHPENNGLSFASPKRTITQGQAIATAGNYCDGFFNELPPPNNGSGNWFIGVNRAILDYTSFNPPSSFSYKTNFIIRNCNIYMQGGGFIADNMVLENSILNASNHPMKNSLLINIRGTNSPGFSFDNNNTAIGHPTIEGSFIVAQYTAFQNNIFSGFNWNTTTGGLNISSYTNALAIKYSLFRNCRFKINGGTGVNETTHTLPTGATDQLKFDNLKTRMATVYGGTPDDYLVGCKYTDAPATDFFIDPSRNNYYLVPNSLPTKMSYDGKYIGARPEGSFIAFNSSNFTYTNFDVNGNIVDQRIDSTATSSIVDMLQIRTINKLDSLGQLAARNGNELNLTETILPNPLIYTDALTLNLTYKVYNGSITVGATVYNIGDCFIAKGASFFSGADTYNPTGITSGTLLIDLGCYEVENNSVTYMGVTYTTGQRFQCYYDSANTFTGTGTVKRFMGGFVRLLSEFYGTTGITAGTTLRYMQTYEVVGGTSVSYNSVVYTPGQRFTALTTPTTFTAVGGSTLREWNIGYPKSLEMKVSKTDATLSTDAWVKMHLTDTPLVNVDINGKVTHGNLDSGFNRVTAVALSCRYWQCRLTVQSLNIPY